MCSTCSLYIDLYVALQSAIDLIHLAQDLAAQYCVHCHRTGVHRCRSHTDRTRVTAWCFDQVQFSQLPLLGELTPQGVGGVGGGTMAKIITFHVDAKGFYIHSYMS